MDVQRFLARLRAAPDYHGQIVHHRRLPGRPARTQDPDRPLDPRLCACLQQIGITRLYTHQAQALDAARAGHHVLVVTSTASGKTLTYNLPVLEAILTQPQARALYLFPTKALAQDQLGKLRQFDLPGLRAGTYDGDTPSHLRAQHRRNLNVVLTNPDMLHMGILPGHGAWAAFLRHLRYVVVDEIHTYRGVFGSHVANVIRRLRRVCQFYGADPQFLCCSATVANPDELMRSLLGPGRDVRVIDDDGSPQGSRHFVFWNPPLGADGSRANLYREATKLWVALLQAGQRTILFGRTRKAAELMLRAARSALRESAPELAGRVASYRAGYHPEQRRQIERALFDGELLGVAATNALELGVDVGSLSACILAGYPGSIASTWQQAGRCGRTQDESLVVLVGSDSPLDQYLMRHPEYFFGQPPEHAIVDPENRQILGQHLVCAAYERALEPDRDGRLFGASARPLLPQLATEGRLRQRGSAYTRAGAGYPAGEVNIRAASNNPFRIVRRDTGEVLGTVEESRAFETIHEGAVYLHQGESFRVDRLDIPGRQATVMPARGDDYTQARTNVDVLLKPAVAERRLARTTAWRGPVEVVTQVVGYRRKQIPSETVLQDVEVSLPPQRVQTEGVWFVVPPEVRDRLTAEGYDLTGSIHALEHAAIGILPLFVLCDRGDVGGVSHPSHPDTGLPTICFHDAVPGGVGIAGKAFAVLGDILRAVLQTIEECPCPEGCPSCVQSPKCGNNNQPLDKAGAAAVLHELGLGQPSPRPADA